MASAKEAATIRALRCRRLIRRLLGKTAGNDSSFTWPAVLQRVLETSNAVTGPTPSLPARRPARFSPAPFPIGETIPKPVTRTRCFSFISAVQLVDMASFLGSAHRSGAKAEINWIRYNGTKEFLVVPAPYHSILPST